VARGQSQVKISLKTRLGDGSIESTCPENQNAKGGAEGEQETSGGKGNENQTGAARFQERPQKWS